MLDTARDELLATVGVDKYHIFDVDKNDIFNLHHCGNRQGPYL
jgi:hypothetical protein